jgi:hypothetical protein
MNRHGSTTSVDQKLLFLRMYHARWQRLETYWCESPLQELGRGMPLIRESNSTVSPPRPLTLGLDLFGVVEETGPAPRSRRAR